MPEEEIQVERRKENLKKISNLDQNSESKNKKIQKRSEFNYIYILILATIGMFFLKDINLEFYVNKALENQMVRKIVSENIIEINKEITYEYKKSLNDINIIEEDILLLKEKMVVLLKPMDENQKIIDFKMYADATEKLDTYKNRLNYISKDYGFMLQRIKKNYSDIEIEDPNKKLKRILDISERISIEKAFLNKRINILDGYVKKYQFSIYTEIIKHIVLMLFLVIIFFIVLKSKEKVLFKEKDRKELEKDQNNTIILNYQLFKVSLKKYMIILYVFLLLLSISINNSTYLITGISAIGIFLAIGLREQLGDVLLWVYMNNAHFSAIKVGDKFKIADAGYPAGIYTLTRVTPLTSILYNSRTNGFLTFKNSDFFKKNRKNIVIENMFNLSLNYILSKNYNFTNFYNEVANMLKKVIKENHKDFEKDFNLIRENFVNVKTRFGDFPKIKTENMSIKIVPEDKDSYRITIDLTIFSTTKKESEIEILLYTEFLEAFKKAELNSNGTGYSDFY
jgi:hypothetical protein